MYISVISVLNKCILQIHNFKKLQICMQPENNANTPVVNDVYNEKVHLHNVSCKWPSSQHKLKHVYVLNCIHFMFISVLCTIFNCKQLWTSLVTVWTCLVTVWTTKYMSLIYVDIY